MSIQLTKGAIQKVMSGIEVTKPILQITGIKRFTAGTDSERYRFSLSDGLHTTTSFMLATQLNNMMQECQLETGSIICLENFVSNKLPKSENKYVVIILEFSVVDKNPSDGIIGDPGLYNPVQSEQNAIARPVAQTSSSNLNTHNSFPQSKFSGKTFPIAALTPYQNRWAICARVSAKGSIRTWNNSKGEGKLFSVTFFDESGEIRATAFNNECDKFFDLLEIGKVYYVSNGYLKTADKRYSSVAHDYEITLGREAIIETCNDSAADEAPQILFNFVPIRSLRDLAKDSVVDILGICKSFGDCQTFMSRTSNREVRKRELQLVDNSKTEISLTLWGDEAEKFDGSLNSVIAVRRARLTDFGGCSLSLSVSSTMQINPDLKEAYSLRSWYDNEGSRSDIQSLSSKAGGPFLSSEWKCLAQVGLENLGMGDKADYFSCKAVIIMIKKDKILYKACANENCNKKVQESDGFYRCEKCNTEVADFKWRLLLQMNLADYSGNLWATCFQDQAETILGKSAQELGNLLENSEEELRAIISEASFESYVFQLRTKMETFNDENRIKTVVVNAKPVNCIEYGQRLLEKLK